MCSREGVRRTVWSRFAAGPAVRQIDLRTTMRGAGALATYQTERALLTATIRPSFVEGLFARSCV